MMGWPQIGSPWRKNRGRRSCLPRPLHLAPPTCYIEIYIQIFPPSLPLPSLPPVGWRVENWWTTPLSGADVLPDSLNKRGSWSQSGQVRIVNNHVEIVDAWKLHLNCADLERILWLFSFFRCFQLQILFVKHSFLLLFDLEEILWQDPDDSSLIALVASDLFVHAWIFLKLSLYVLFFCFVKVSTGWRKRCNLIFALGLRAPPLLQHLNKGALSGNDDLVKPDPPIT